MAAETGEVVWTAPASLVAESVTGRFMARHGLVAYDELLRRSIDEPEWFWPAVVEFLGIPFSRPWTSVLDETAGPMWTTWFDGSQINLCDVCVDRWAVETPTATAVVVEHEDGTSAERTFAELLDEVRAVAAVLHESGIRAGDRVAAFLPMGIDVIVTLLATARVGAVFVPIFSGFGAPAVASRLTDAGARVLVCADGFRRRAKPVQMKAVADSAAGSAGVERVIVVRHDGDLEVPWHESRDAWLDDLVATVGEDARAAGHDPAPTGPEDPVLLAYTSGTTGRPKGVVHVHGGFTVKLAQEAAFQTDVRPGDRLSWLTDMGWIMGPWMTVGALANGAAVVAYDGAPDHPTPARPWELAERHRVTQLGVSPTLIRALAARGDEHGRGHDLSALRAFGSTGEPWNPDPWSWLFERVGGGRIPIVNLSGGTEVGACFLSVNLLQGIKPISLGGPSLGMAMGVTDDHGRPVAAGEVGELVCTRPWPGMTRGIWGDPERYLRTYWSRIDGVWVHGDWASIDEDGFWYLHGRSDDTLNVAGKRLGPAEVESIAVGHPGVVMAAAVGLPDPTKGEVLAVYVVPSAPAADAATLAAEVSDAVVAELGPAFRPAMVAIVDDLPRTRSAKIVRRAVRARAIGADVGDLSSVENPDSLAQVTPVRDAAGNDLGTPNV